MDDRPCAAAADHCGVPSCCRRRRLPAPTGSAVRGRRCARCRPSRRPPPRGSRRSGSRLIGATGPPEPHREHSRVTCTSPLANPSEWAIHFLTPRDGSWGEGRKRVAEGCGSPRPAGRGRMPSRRPFGDDRLDSLGGHLAARCGILVSIPSPSELTTSRRGCSPAGRRCRGCDFAEYTSTPGARRRYRRRCRPRWSAGSSASASDHRRRAAPKVRRCR